MNKKSLLHLTWLIPVFLFVLLFQQWSVYNGINKTMKEGEVYTAAITDFRIKQIAAQTNGYVDLFFIDNSGNYVEQRLTLHVQHASRLIGKNDVDIRYLPDTTYDIVIIETFKYHNNTVLINLAVIGLSLMVLIPLSVFASRYSLGKVKGARNDNITLEFVK
jgi:hypothetical protein